MEQQQATNPRPKMDFNSMTTIQLSDHLDEVLSRAKAFAEIVESNSLDGVTAFQTIDHDGIAKLSWQICENLELAQDLNVELWKRFRLVSGQEQAKG